MTDDPSTEAPGLLQEDEAGRQPSALLLKLKRKEEAAARKAQRLAAKLKHIIEEAAPYPAND